MEAWKKLSIASEGLQSANIELVALLKKRRTAYALLAVFPLGLHRDYLENKVGAWAYRFITLIALVLALSGYQLFALSIFAMALIFAVYDLRWIDDAVATLNKAARMKVYKKPGLTAPKAFRGHYVDTELDDYLQEKAAEQPMQAATHPRPAKRIPSFSEQEAMLRELQKSKQIK